MATVYLSAVFKKSNGPVKSLQALRKVNIATVASAGVARGIKILNRS